MVKSDYSHIWDCCCDHGFLGARLLDREAAPHVHFVDIVPELMDNLRTRLGHFYLESTSSWSTHCLDVAQLPLQQYQGKHLVIIAGVGGDLMTQFVRDIHNHHPELDIDFLLCPVYQQYALRQQLIDFNFSVIQEKVVEDNQRYYEILYISRTSCQANPVGPVGRQMWQEHNEEQQRVLIRYRDKVLNHYQRIHSGGKENVQHIIDAYLAIQIHTEELA
jgi:tRNA (adenine22-N1)-methyltransferase